MKYIEHMYVTDTRTRCFNSIH